MIRGTGIQYGGKQADQDILARENRKKRIQKVLTKYGVGNAGPGTGETAQAKLSTGYKRGTGSIAEKPSPEKLRRGNAGALLSGLGRSDTGDIGSYTPLNTYNMNLTRGVSAMRGAVTQKAEEKWGPAGSFAYGVGMSMADFLTQAGATGAGNLTLGIMGSSAAANTTMECVDRGLTNRQALTLGAIAGLAEIVTEKVSLEALLDRTSLNRSAMGYFLKNVLAEGSEEVASDLINWAADVMVSREKSQWRQAIRGYENQGYSEGEAYGLALKDQAIEMGMSFLGGAISGGVMAGGNVAVNGYLDQSSTEKLTLADDAAADDILRDRTAISFLTRKGGLELNSDMTQAEKRRAVKEAVERVTAAQEETVLPEGEASTIIEVDEAPFTIGTSLGAKAKNYDVMDLESGEMYHFVEGSKIQDVNIFAGKGSHIPFRKASFFAQRYGGVAEDWQHVKGYALLETSDGDRMAEVHWVQCGEIGKFEFFVKEWLD